mgnify:CR=1 FL=1
MRNPYPACVNFRLRPEYCAEPKEIEFSELFSNGFIFQ